MKKPVLFTILTGAVICVLAGAFFAHVIPYGNKVKAFQKEFTITRQTIERSEKSVMSTSSPREFHNAMLALDSAAMQLRELESMLSSLETSKNFIRQLWQKISISSNDLASASSIITKTKETLPECAADMMSRYRDTMTESLKQNDTWEVFVNKTKSLKESSTTGVLALREASKQANCDDKRYRNLAVKVKGALDSLCDAAVSTLNEHRKGSATSLESEIKTASTVKSADDICSKHLQWIKGAQSTLSEISQLGGQKNVIAQEYDLFKADTRRIDAILNTLKSLVSAQKKANESMKDGILLMDNANVSLQNLERFASASDIQFVHEKWSGALTNLNRAEAALRVPSGYDDTRRTLWGNCNANALNNVKQALSDAREHLTFVDEKWAEAKRDESTVGGSLVRGTRRGLDRIGGWLSDQVQQASESRIGQEIGVAAQVLILGTKMFYDLQDPNKDLITWSLSYQGDIEKLMKDVDQVEQMEGPSLTDKNAIFESLVDKAYEKSFKK